MEAKRRKHDGGGVSLPEDIIFEVLARLQTKTLCRFRCVCKAWHALISDPAFVTAQRSHAVDRHLVGLFSGPRDLPEVRVMDMDGNIVSTFEIARTRSTPLPQQLPTRPDLICNDGRGAIIIDPAAAEAYAVFDTRYLDRSDMSSYSTILGRAAPSGDFKILRLQEPFLMDDHGHGGSHHQLCEVATIMHCRGGGTAEPLSWRQKSAPPFGITGLIYDHRVVVNGVVYFVNNELETESGCYFTPNLNRIVAFNLESEEWKVEAINGPTLGNKKERERWSFALVELKGTLAVVHDVCVNNYMYSSIWLLIDPAKSVWVKEYMIPRPKNQIGTTKPLGVLNDGRILLWSRVSQNEETRQDNTSFRRHGHVVLFYDPSTKAFTDFVEMAEGFRSTLFFYIGSLLSSHIIVGRHRCVDIFHDDAKEVL